MKERDGFGLVFAGGGGKGAYEIGVWKALREAEDIKIGAVSGTSVGALNAVLFAIGSYDVAEDIWLHIDTNKILTPKELKFRDYLSEWTTWISMLCANISGVITWSMAVFITKYLNSHNGLFTRKGLKEIIQKAGIADKIYASKMPCYATCYNLSELRTQYFQIDNRLTPEKIESVLLASSAIPLVFPKENIDGKMYYDGGIPYVGDNVPVKPLYDAGWRQIIVVHLEREEIDHFSRDYKGCQFIHIFPRNNQGGIFDGTLDFDPESAKQRLDQGYKDMKRQIGILKGLDNHLENREEKAQKIHSASVEYHAFMNENMELDMDEPFEEICTKFSKNRLRMNNFVLKGVAAISAADALLDERQRKKGVFQNILGEISGKNKKLQHGIDKSLINSQRDIVQMISRLVESDVISLEVIQSLQSELYGTTSKMVQVLQEHGKDIEALNYDFEEIHREYNKLVYQDKKLAEDVEKLYASIFDTSKRMTENFNNIQDEMGKLKDVQNLHTWCINLKFRQFDGKEYRHLDIIEKIICVVSDFFCLTGGVWNNELLLFIKAGLDALGIEPCEKISCSDVIYKLAIDKRYRDYLFKRNGVYYSFGDDEDEMITPCESLIQGVYIADKLADNQKSITVEQIENYLSAQKVSKEKYLTAFDIACMLLVVMSQYHESVNDGKNLLPYRELEKKALLGDVEAMQNYVRVLLENNYVEEAFDRITMWDEMIPEDDNYFALKCEVAERYDYLR